jgi:hypothetical protein
MRGYDRKARSEAGETGVSQIVPRVLRTVSVPRKETVVAASRHIIPYFRPLEEGRISVYKLCMRA